VTILEPPASSAAAPFWEATRHDELVLPWCTACERPFWYPREICPGCLGTDIDWRPASGDGEVYAVSVQHRGGPGRNEADGPYAVALIELAEGVRVMTNVVGCPPDDVAVGMAVRATWEPLSDGRKLLQMTPVR
jgi:uncharacterized protein